MECRTFLMVPKGIQEGSLQGTPGVLVKEASMECHWFLVVSKGILTIDSFI